MTLLIALLKWKFDLLDFSERLIRGFNDPMGQR
jgi:hypothetical protein